jgi:hypothetical protein
MLECLLVKTRGISQMVEAGHEKMKTHKERMVAKMETCHEMMNTCLEDMRANQKKLEAKMETSHETEAVVQRYNWAPCVKATCMVTDP